MPVSRVACFQRPFVENSLPDEQGSSGPGPVFCCIGLGQRYTGCFAKHDWCLFVCLFRKPKLFDKVFVVLGVLEELVLA